MTQWVENPRGGRERGPRAILRAWVEVLLRPRRFFRTAVAPGDQAPGLIFAICVVIVEETVRAVLVPSAFPVVANQPTLSTVLWIAVAAFLVTPASLHLAGALQTVLLIPFVSDRAGVSETVQVLAYATAPVVVAGVPNPAVRVVCGAYGAALLVVGIATVHGTSLERATLVGALPASFVFGYGFRAFPALVEILRRWYII